MIGGDRVPENHLPRFVIRGLTGELRFTHGCGRRFSPFPRSENFRSVEHVTVKKFCGLTGKTEQFLPPKTIFATAKVLFDQRIFVRIRIDLAENEPSHVFRFEHGAKFAGSGDQGVEFQEEFRWTSELKSRKHAVDSRALLSQPRFHPRSLNNNAFAAKWIFAMHIDRFGKRFRKRDQTIALVQTKLWIHRNLPV